MRVLPLSLVMLLFGAVLLMPLATAQTSAIVTVATDFTQLGPDGRLHPETEEMTGSVWADIAIPPGGFCVQSIPAYFSVKQWPGYATVQIQNPVQYLQITLSPTWTVYSLKTLVSVSITRDAPAFEDGLYGFSVSIEPPSLPGGCSVGAGWGSAQAIIKNDYVPGIRIGDAIMAHEGMSGWIDIPIENIANGPTRVYAVLAPESPQSFVLLNANDLRLESRAISGADSSWTGVMRVDYVLDNVAAAPLHVRLLAGHDMGQTDYDQADLDYTAIGTLPEGAEASESKEIRPNEDGSVPAVPGPSIPVLMLIGGVLLAMVRRRRH